MVETFTLRVSDSDRLTDRMVLMDYEDYDEMEAISSDDIYYDAGQSQLMGSSNFEKVQF